MSTERRYAGNNLHPGFQRPSSFRHLHQPFRLVPSLQCSNRREVDSPGSSTLALLMSFQRHSESGKRLVHRIGPQTRRTRQFQKSIASRTTTITVFENFQLNSTSRRDNIHQKDIAFGKKSSEDVHHDRSYSEEVEKEEG
jgi:hypothetical protein